MGACEEKRNMKAPEGRDSPWGIALPIVLSRSWGEAALQRSVQPRMARSLKRMSVQLHLVELGLKRLAAVQLCVLSVSEELQAALLQDLPGAGIVYRMF